MPTKTSRTVEAIQAAMEQSQPERLMVRRPAGSLKVTVENGNLLSRELAGMGLGSTGSALEATGPNGEQLSGTTTPRAMVKATKSRLKPKKAKAKKVKAKFKP